MTIPPAVVSIVVKEELHTGAIFRTVRLAFNCYMQFPCRRNVPISEHVDRIPHIKRGIYLPPDTLPGM